MSKYVSAHNNARRIEEPKKKKYISAHSGAERNKGGLIEGAGYVAGNLGLGLAGVVEGVTDVAAAGGHLLRGDVQMAKQPFLDNQTAQAQQDLTEWYNPGKGMQFAGDVASGVGQSSVFLLDALVPGLGTGLFFGGITGQSVAGAAQQTGDVGLKEIGYGVASGAAEAALGKLVGAGGKVAGKLSSSLTRSTGKAVGQRGITNALTRATGKKLVSMGLNVAKNTLADAASEFTEEFAAEYIDTSLQILFGIDPNASTSFGKAFRAGAVGFVSGAAMGAPANVYNYKNSVAAGRAIREEGGVDQLLYRAAATVDVLKEQEEQAREKGRTKATVPEDAGVVGKTAAKGKQVVANLGDKIKASKTKGYWTKLEKNINAYTSMDEAMRNSEAGDALLGELRGNLFFTNMSYAVEEAEEDLKTATDEQITEWLIEVNDKAKKAGKADASYTVEDFRANKDGILSTVAAAFWIDEIRRTAKATEKPTEATTSPWDGMTDHEDMSGYKATGEAEQALLKAAVNQGVPRGSVPAMLEQFRKGTKLTPAEFAEGWADGAHKYGRYGFDASEDGDTAFGRMEPEAREAAMKFGRETEETERKAAEEKAKAKKKPAAQAGKKGTVVRGKGLEIKTLSDEQYAAYKAAEVLAEVLGTEIVIETAITDKKGRTVNGYYDTKTNRLHVNINALRDGKNISLYTLGHEVTHYIKEWSPTKFEALADFVLDQMGVDAETAVADKLASLKRLGIVTDTMTVAEANALAREELVAEGMELVLTDGKVLEELSKTDKSLWEKIRDWFFDIIGQIRRSWQDLNQASKTARVLKETVESLEEIERLFTEGAREAGERTRTAGVEINPNDKGKKYDIAILDDGRMFVYASRNVITGTGVNRWRGQITKFFKDLLENKVSLDIPTQEGDVLTITMDQTEYKARDNYKHAAGNRVRLTDDEFLVKLHAEAHIDELAEIAKRENRPKVSDDKNHDFAKDGFTYRTAYFQDFDGKYYKIRFSIGHNGDVATVYNVGQIKEDVLPSAKLIAVLGSKGPWSTSSKGSITQPEDSVNSKFSISEENPSTLSAEDQNLLFDADFYERYENESREPITETVQELEAIKSSEAFATMSDDEAFDINAKLKAKRAGYNTVYDYYVETEKERMAEEYRRYVQTGRSNRTSRTLEEKRKKAQKERTLRSDVDSATPLKNAQYQIIQETNPMWDEYHTGIRSPKDIKTFAEVVEDPDSFNWGDFTREDAEKALRDGTVRVYSSYAIKNGVFVSTSYKQALQYAGNNPDGVHTRVVALDSVAWINGDEGQYAKVYKSEKRYSVEDTTEWGEDGENGDESAFDEALRRSGLADIVDGLDEVAPEAEKRTAEALLFAGGNDDMRRRLIEDHIMLADALMEAAQSQHEYEVAKNYRAKAEELANLEINLVELRKRTAALNRNIEELQSKAKGYDKENRPKWITKELDGAMAQKTAWLAEMDEIKERISDEKHKLLSLTSTKPFGRLLHEAEKKAAAMERSAERTREREKAHITAERERSRKREAKIREKADERVKKARQDAQDYKTAIHKTSMERVYKARRDATDYKRAVYRRAYEKAEEKNRKYRETMDRKAGESKERGEITARKRTVMRELGSLETKLYHPTKTNHVPKGLHDLAMKTLAAADPKAFEANRRNIREMGELTAKIEQLERKAMRTAKEQETLDRMKAKYEHLESETIPLKKQAEAMLTAFVEYNENAPDELKLPKGIVNIMTNRVAEIEDAPLSKMGLRSLEAVETFVRILSQQIKTENELFTQKRGEQVSDWGNAASREAAESKPLKWLSPKSMEIKNARDVRDFLWKNMKPLTVFEAIGSPKLMELFHSVLDGEEVWITDVLEAREVILKAKERHKYDTWDLKTRHEFTNAEGKVVRLTVGEMMSLYAYAKREQAMGHLRGGGFVLNAGATEITEKRKVRTERRMNLTERYTMTEEDMGKLAGMLTEDQKRYADEMQDYLTSLGAKGNEISQKLYGLDLFKEKHYFPIKVKSEYLESQTGKTGDPKIKNRGMAKETVPDAENPLVLQDFMDIFDGHVNDMATYHAFVLPVEDLTRVLNYQPSNAIIDDEGNWTEDKERKEYSTLKAVIESKYGAQANAYIEQLIRDLNGGARREAAASLIDKGITAFKRASTMASLSVLVQQPTSLFRAMAYVDPKYFRSLAALDIKGHKEAWEQVKKYAKVAAIKEMGGYDTGVGTRTADYLSSKEYKTWGDKAKAFFLPDVYGGDSNYRAEIFGKGAAYADELAWIQMFDACKREQAEKLGKPMDSEEVLEAAGKRFTEVVRRTQVYDATLARSEYMRSKDTGMKMATAFMAEPTTVVSMMLDGLIRSNRGDKAFFKKTAGAIAASVIFNALAVSLVYAARDDDEEKTFAEKYLATLATETAEGFNPLEYLPYTRDIMSLMKGYDIERTDMALFADLFKSFERITSSTRTPAEKTAEVAGAVGAFFGVPIRNLVRDAMMPVNLVQGAMSGERTTGKGISAAMADEFSLITNLFGADTTNANQLYKAAKSGDEAHYNRVASRYKSEQAAEMALRTALRENDKRIAEAAEAKISGELEAYESIIDQIEREGRFDRNLIIRAINNEVLDIKDSAEQVTAPEEDATDEDEDTPESLYNASDLNDALTRGDREDFEDIYYYLLATKQEQGKTEAQAKAAVKSGITSYWKKQYLAAWEENNTAEMKRILELLEGTELYGEYNDVATMASKWIKES